MIKKRQQRLQWLHHFIFSRNRVSAIIIQQMERGWDV
jgi:hypothetical protein